MSFVGLPSALVVHWTPPRSLQLQISSYEASTESAEASSRDLVAWKWPPAAAQSRGVKLDSSKSPRSGETMKKQGNTGTPAIFAALVL